MRVLEARFHAGKKGAEGRSVVVGRVLCDGPSVLIQPAPSPGRELDQEAMLTKLRFLVDSCLPDPPERLLHLRSDFWSFAEIDAEGQNLIPGSDFG